MATAGRVARAIDAAVKQADGMNTDGGVRLNRYGEQVTAPVFTTKHSLAEEGEYFVVTNPTPGTAVADAVNASSDFTKSAFVFYNTDVTGGKRCFLDYVKILPTVAPASATSLQLAIQIDNGNRYTSGGTGPTSGVNVNGDSGLASVGKLYYCSGGAVITTASATSAVRLVHRSTPRSVIPAVLEEIVISFGNDATVGSSSGTTAGRSGVNGAPLIVGPGQSAVFNVWFPSNAITGISFEFEFAWFER